MNLNAQIHSSKLLQEKPVSAEKETIERVRPSFVTLLAGLAVGQSHEGEGETASVTVTVFTISVTQFQARLCCSPAPGLRTNLHRAAARRLELAPNCAYDFFELYDSIEKMRDAGTSYGSGEVRNPPQRFTPSSAPDHGPCLFHGPDRDQSADPVNTPLNSAIFR